MLSKIKTIAAAAACCMYLVCTAGTVSADEAYKVYNYDRWGEAVASQAGYTALRTVSGTELGAGALSSPGDIFIDESGSFYIADSGNNRIVVTDSELSQTQYILDTLSSDSGDMKLRNPKGVFVGSDSSIYIADTDNSRVIRCDKNGKASLVITRPESDLYPDNLTFLPQKVIVDNAGYIYVTVTNITSGSLMYDKEGRFLGFYGANRVKKTGKVVIDYIRKLFAPDSMRKYMTDSVPSPITNFDIDSDGFIYTCCSSRKQDIDMIKKVNTAGYNLFADYDVSFGDCPTPDYSNMPRNSFVDLDVSADGTINCLDFETGRIFQYDKECNLLFIFGGAGDQTGTFRQVSAVEASGTKIYVADSQKNSITVFDQTVFGSYVHKAVNLYNDGYYDEALGPWREVLRRDGNYRLANIGIASALINNGRYAQAMKYAKKADSQLLYNRAFEGWRTQVINENFSWAASAAALIIFGTAVIRLSGKKQRNEKNDSTGAGGSSI